MVRMHRMRGGVNGIYSCKIPDDGGVQILYVGVYTNTTGQLTCYVFIQTFIISFDSSGALEVMPLQFQLTSELNATTPTFTLMRVNVGVVAFWWSCHYHLLDSKQPHSD